MVEINVAKDFSIYPAGRYLTDGPNSGQRFREEFLLPNLGKPENIVVVLEGTRGYPSSFLEEAFGGIVRNTKYTAAQLHDRLTLKAGDPAYKRYIPDIWGYIDAASNDATN